MFRTHPSGKQASNNVSASSSRSTSNENSPTTIREIRSRATGSSSSGTTRQLLANRRQAMSMEKLNGSPTAAVPASQSSNDKQKGSPLSGSQSRLNGSTSPSRGAGLNRTASRVSRFRSAKAVFERLSSANNHSTKIYDKPTTSDRPKGTVASRYAAAAAARATINSNVNTNVNTSPRSKAVGSLARSHDSGKSSSNMEMSRYATTPSRTDSGQPKPQPRVVMTRTAPMPIDDTKNQSPGQTRNLSQHSKPPPKDLIDKIVLEIARDAGKQPPDANCTIQDLSNCDISGIPETLDFDRCFQDVEMMTEEEARKLLSRKSDSPVSPGAPTVKQEESILPVMSSFKSTEAQGRNPNDAHDLGQNEVDLDSSSDQSKRNKVRFSEEPVEIFNTHAVEDYDRRNDDIDPVAASAEYEIEKSRERDGIRDSDDDEEPNTADPGHRNDQETNKQNHQPSTSIIQDHNSNHSREEKSDNKEYIESLEREVSLKRILEQNLRDLQSQYYAAVKELDDHKTSSENKLTELQQNISDVNTKLEISQNELSDSREKSSQFEKQLNDIKESSQILEKKYHRAKKIIKDMQSREQSFNRREQLYQQKLDEIEHELGVLIESIDRTIYDEGLKYFSMADNSNCQRQHRYKLDVFGLIRQMLKDFNDDQSTQNPQIKQRVISILEQKLANLMATADGTTNYSKESGVLQMKNSASIDDPQLKAQSHDHDRQSQNSRYQLASHRLSQPNLPHPIGVGGQPTKLFHNINPIPIATNEPSPPQSVNSYPSTNSLNSLNNNNSHLTNNNNNNGTKAPRLNDPPSNGDYQLNMMIPSSTGASGDDKFQPAHDIQVPYQTNEWHDKPVSEWTTTQVSTWLLALGLEQYISKFEDRNVNGQSLINLDSTVLKGLGVLNSNDRNLLKKKIRELRNEMERERKLIEKKMKENLKDKSKSKFNSGKPENGNEIHQNKPSWKRGLLS